MAILNSGGVVSTATENGGGEFVDLDRLRRPKSRSDSNGLISSSDNFPSDDVGPPTDVRDRIDSVVNDDTQGTANLAGDNNGGDTEIRETGGGRGGGEGRGNAEATFTYRPSVPAHRRARESPLSSDAIFKQSHVGLFNLCVVVLIAVNSRLIIENLMKVVIFLHIIITMTEILYPVYITLRCDSAFLSGVTLMLLTCIVWLKLVSYAHTSYNIRSLANAADKANPEVSY